MEPIKINVQLSAEAELLDALRQIASLCLAAGLLKESKGEEKKDEALTPVNGRTPHPKPFEETVAEEKAPVEAAPAAPEEPAPFVSDDEVLAVIKELKAVVPAKAIKEVFNQYGISCSTACPQERRAAMIADIKALRNA